MELTYFGHSCFLVKTGGKKILFDPFIAGNSLASAIKIDEIEADYILLTHGHADHTADVERIAKRTGAKVVANYEVISWFENKGLSNTHPMNHGGKVKFDFGTVKMVNAVHSSSMPDGSYGGNPAGFVVETVERSFYHAGDTALTMDMKLIGDQHELDFAILPIGDNFTMGIDDALVAAKYVGVKQIIGAHYDTFPYIAIDHKEVMNKAEAKQRKLQLLKIGETIVI